MKKMADVIERTLGKILYKKKYEDEEEDEKPEKDKKGKDCKGRKRWV